MSIVLAPRPSIARRRLLLPAVLCSVLLAVAACDSAEVTPPADGSAPAATAAGSDAPPAASADPAAVAAVAAVIEAVDPADATTLQALDRARWEEGAAEAAAQALAAGGDAATRWAATVAYVTSGDDPAVLKPLLEDEDPSVRATAALALLAAGDKDAIPVLVALTGSEERLTGSRPPLEIGRWVSDALAWALDDAMYVPDARGAAAQQAWEAWLTVHADGVSFDPASGTWSVK